MIFVVEDERVLRKSLVDFLSLGERAVEGFESAEEALAAARESPPDVVISDLQLPGMGGLELLEELGRLDPQMVRIAITAHASTKSVLAAMRSGCYEYLEKPLDLEQLERLVERALSERRSSREPTDWRRAGALASTTSSGSSAGRSRSASAMARMWAGVLPQHAPMISAPSARTRRA